MAKYRIRHNNDGSYTVRGIRMDGKQLRAMVTLTSPNEREVSKTMKDVYSKLYPASSEPGPAEDSAGLLKVAR